MAAGDKNEIVFDLIKSMSKAEKRHFKLYAARQSTGGEAKFVALFDAMDSLPEYDTAKVLARCNVKREQLPNMKAHLYRQILVSLRLLGAQHSASIQLREQIDFAGILYDKGLYGQSSRLLKKAGQQAIELQQRTIALNILDTLRTLETLNISKGLAGRSESLTRQSSELCDQITSTNELANLSAQLYDLHQKLGYARNKKDFDMLESYFAPRIEKFRDRQTTFLDRFYFYQAEAWYSYIRHDFVRSYQYACRWVDLFDSQPDMKQLMYDSYLRGYARILDGLFLMRKHRLFVDRLHRFERECAIVGSSCDNAVIISRHILYTGRVNRYFIEGRFAEGVQMVPHIEEYLERYSKNLGIHVCMTLFYKIACLYFGNADYDRCMEYLSRIIECKDPQIRRDLQCYAKILNLIASYDSGKDYNLEYQIRSVYSFLTKMNDMQMVQREMMAFLKRVGRIYDNDLNAELKLLYDKLKPYENHPYERRTFYYLDILSWLESKITGRSVAEIIRSRFLASR